MITDGLRAFLLLVGAVVVGLIVGLVFLAVVFGIGYQIEEWLDDRKNKKNGNLHITVDQSWKEKMK